MRSSKIKALALVIAIVGSTGLGGCTNLFDEFADKTSADALIYQAKMEIDNQEYDRAIEIIDSVPSGDQSRHDFAIVKASAYAGRCGLNLISLADVIANQLGSSTVMQVLMLSLKSATSYADCVIAENVLRAQPASTMTPDDYVFLAFVSFAKIGATLASSGADADNDGYVDGSFNPCTDNASNIQNAAVKEVGSGIFTAVDSIDKSGIALAGSLTSTLTSTCSTLSLDCSARTSADVTDVQAKLIRTLMNATEIGFGTCGSTVNDVTCVCL